LGDISELRGLIVVMSFIGVYALLIALMPSQLFTAGDIRDVEVPELFDSVDILAYAQTCTVHTNETGGKVVGNYYKVELKTAGGEDLGNRDLDLKYKLNSSTPYNMYVNHYWKEWVIFTYVEKLDFYHEGIGLGNYLSPAIMEQYVDSNENDTASFMLVSTRHKFQYYFSVGFNSTSWNNFTHAWQNKDLYIFVAVDFDNVHTSYNAWQIVGMLLFFSLPEINPIIKAMISIPIWICIAYLIYVLIIKVIPLIAGG